MKDNYCFNKILEKLLSYEGKDTFILNLKNTLLDYYNANKVTDTSLVTDSAELPNNHQGVALCSGGKVVLGSKIVKYVKIGDELKPYELHGIPVKVGKSHKVVGLDIDEEELVSEAIDISEDAKIKLADRFAKRELICNPRHSVHLDYSHISELAKNAFPDRVQFLEEDATPFTPAYVGGSTIAESEALYVDRNDNIIIGKIAESNNTDLRMVLYKSDKKDIYTHTFEITEHTAISESGCRAYPVNSVYNDPELVHKVNIYEATKMARKINRKAKKGISKLADAPVKFMREMQDLDKKLRRGITNMRRAREQRYKEQILNDEVLPVADEMFRLFISGLTTVGLGMIAGPAGALMGAAVSFLINAILKANFKNRREICIKILDDQIAQAESEIEDARSENDLETKRALEQVIRELKR